MAKKFQFSETILRLLAGKKALSVADLSQEVLGSMDGVEDPSKAKYAVNRAIKNLEEGGLTESLKSPNRTFVRLTPAGRQKAASLKLEDTSTPVPLSWDGSWRIVLLDLPEPRKKEREALRYLLKKAGFVLLKNSAWISPYPFEFLFSNIKKDFGLTTEFIILKTQTLDAETEEQLLRLYHLQ